MACLKFVKKYKSLAVEGGRDDYLFWMNETKLNNIVWGLNELTPAYQVIKS